MGKDAYPPEFLKRLEAVRGKRSRIVVEHILKHGHITSEDLQRTYGYEHPPRAVRDVREQGIPIETFAVQSAEGRRIAAYRFGDPSRVRAHRLSGRSVFPKALKRSLVDHHGPRCAVCLCVHEGRHLQVDHRVPYEVAGDAAEGERDPGAFMLLCGSCNRAKSWSCEHCPNWLEERDPAICDTCYWARPDNYKHIGLRDIRRVEVVWTEDEVEVYERVKAKARAAHTELPDFVKSVIEKHVRGKRG